MKLIFIRHGDPDYTTDSLTEKGKKEAALLAATINDFGIDEVYQSPLGRARETAAYCLEKLGKTAETFEWLQEFPAVFDPNLSESAREAYKTDLEIDPQTGKYKKRITWDMLPSYYMNHPELFDKKAWRESELVTCSDMVSVYDHVTTEFDKFLERQGYKRNGMIYSTEQGNNKTIAIFCHFGITAVFLSHLWNISPFVPLQFMAFAPTSVTEIATEEREKGIVTFRTLRGGDITHLTMAGEERSFAARFCEAYDNVNERH
ncbi:MAG: histidine phosphatase family protein [Butyrivibrio sp.]|nr:histidine phosphatase family protein [Butyrivibrio sp.]